MPRPEPAPVCDLGALGGRRGRHRALLRRLLGAARRVRETSRAVVLELPGEPALFRAAAAWISLERRCCGFLGFALEWKRDGAVRLQLRADAAGRQAVRAALATLAAE